MLLCARLPARPPIVAAIADALVSAPGVAPSLYCWAIDLGSSQAMPVVSTESHVPCLLMSCVRATQRTCRRQNSPTPVSAPIPLTTHPEDVSSIGRRDDSKPDAIGYSPTQYRCCDDLMAAPAPIAGNRTFNYQGVERATAERDSLLSATCNASNRNAVRNSRLNRRSLLLQIGMAPTGNIDHVRASHRLLSLAYNSLKRSCATAQVKRGKK